MIKNKTLSTINATFINQLLNVLIIQFFQIHSYTNLPAGFPADRHGRLTIPQKINENIKTNQNIQKEAQFNRLGLCFLTAKYARILPGSQSDNIILLLIFRYLVESK
ncbi:MAG: hypothetical protein ABFR05_13135 [Bacteroidota bacterium]